MSFFINSIPRTNVQASGGTTQSAFIDATGQEYKIHAFEKVGSDTFTVAQGGEIDVLIVAGGGAGGLNGGAGGGAGGLIYRPSLHISAGSYSITVGAGGEGRNVLYENIGNGGNGGDSSAFGLTAKGGGGGDGASPFTKGNDGGSGGGGGDNGAGRSTGTQSSQPGESGEFGFGNDGGIHPDYAGGGGGAGEQGGDDGAGGDGLNFGDKFGTAFGDTRATTSITINEGEAWFAGGGTGEKRSAYVARGGSSDNLPTGSGGFINDSLPNTGAGGSGVNTSGGGGRSGNGGSGIVLIRYKVQKLPSIDIFASYLKLPNQSQVLDLPSDNGSANEVFVPFGNETIMFVGRQSGFIEKYQLSAPFDLTGATRAQTYATAQNNYGSRGLWIKEDGKYAIYNDYATNKLYEFTMSSAYDLSTAVETNEVGLGTNDADGCWMNPAGSILYIMERNPGKILQYNLGTPRDISTIGSPVAELDVSYLSAGSSIKISQDGTRMYVASYSADMKLFQYTLSQPYEISSASLDGSTPSFDYPEGFAFSNNLQHIFVTDYTGQQIERHSRSKGTQDLPFISVQDANDNNAPRGLHYFKNTSGVTKQMYYDPDDGGWILLAANDARKGTIPGGTARHDLTYSLDRNGNNSSLGDPNPNSDYIVGNWYMSFAFSEARVLAWGYQSTDGTFSYPDNLGTFLDAQWSASSRDDIVPRANVNVDTNGPTLSSNARYFVIDATYKDSVNGGFAANSNQTTIGGAGVQQSDGDPDSGTYLGHGSSEGSYEGWIASGADDSQGYTTWVR